MIVPFAHLLVLASLLFFLGLMAVLVRRNLIMILIGIEVMLNAAGLVLVGASAMWQQLDGQVMVIFLMALTSAEVSISLAMVVYLNRRKRTVDVRAFNELRG